MDGHLQDALILHCRLLDCIHEEAAFLLLIIHQERIIEGNNIISHLRSPEKSLPVDRQFRTVPLLQPQHPASELKQEQHNEAKARHKPDDQRLRAGLYP